MSVEANPTGHLGNLTPEQEDCLRKLWAAIGKVTGIVDSEASDGTNGAPISKTASISSQQPPESPQKRRFGLLNRWRSSETQETPAEPENKGSADENDKHGQSKQFQKMLASHTPESIRTTFWDMVHSDHPDRLALRFLRARKWDVQKALVMLLSTVHWRKDTMHIDEDIMTKGEIGMINDEKNGTAAEKRFATDFMTQSRMGKCFLHGTDRQGRPLCVVRVRLHKPGAQSAESLERYTVYIIESARIMLDSPIETATIVFDMTGFGLSNMDYHPVKFIIQCFEANYPECLGAILIHNAPWVFQGIWKIIRGWLDPVVAAKVHFTNYRAGLEEYIEPSKIIKELEGDEDWEYKYDEPTGDEDEKLKDTKTRDEILEGRKKLYSDFEAATVAWIKSPEGEEGRKAKADRERIATELHSSYWKLDPYVRSRSLYDRRGEVLPEGGADWYHVKAKANGVANGAAAAPATNGNGTVKPE